MRRLPLLVGVVALAVAGAVALAGALGPARHVETGWVANVDARSLTEVDGFTLRTADGRTLDFTIGRLELDAGAFPAGHLREHLALNQPVVVTWRDDGRVRVAVRLEDAPLGPDSGSPAP